MPQKNGSLHHPEPHVGALEVLPGSGPLPWPNPSLCPGSTQHLQASGRANQIADNSLPCLYDNDNKRMTKEKRSLEVWFLQRESGNLVVGVIMVIE